MASAALHMQSAPCLSRVKSNTASALGIGQNPPTCGPAWHRQLKQHKLPEELKYVHEAMRRKARLAFPSKRTAQQIREDNAQRARQQIQLAQSVTAPLLDGEELAAPDTDTPRTASRKQLLAAPEAYKQQVEIDRWLSRRQKVVRRKVSASEERKYRQIFDMIDLDGSQSLEIDELQVQRVRILA